MRRRRVAQDRNGSRTIESGAGRGPVSAAVKISIIIPVKNAGPSILTCLQRIQDARTPHEIIVVDDHSSDSSLQGLEPYVDEFVRLEGATGAGAARNAGAKYATADILLFIDADVFTSGSDIDKSYEEFVSSGFECAVANYRDNRTLSLVARNYNYYMMYKYSGRAQTRIFFTSFAMIRKERWLPFSEHLSFLEDAEAGQRLAAAGVVINLFKTVEVLHQKQIGLAGLARLFFFRAREALILAWVYRREGRVMQDDSIRAGTRLSLVLVPAILLVLPLPEIALLPAIFFVLVNANYFTYILRHEGLIKTPFHVLVYFFTIIFADIGIICGALKVCRHEFLAPLKI